MIIKSKGYSIKFVLLYIVFSISIIGIIAMFINQTVNKKINNEVNLLVNMNIKLTSLKTHLSNNSSLISGYFSRDNDNFYVEYKENIEQIQVLGSSIYETVREDEKSIMYHRILNNMVEYEKELSDELFRIQKVDIQAYEKHHNIKVLYSYLDNISNNLTEACITYQTERYEEIYNIYQKIQTAIYVGLILIILLNYLYIIQLIENIISSFNIFRKAATNLAKGNWSIPDLKRQKCRELDLFATTFNKMKDNIQENIKHIEINSQLKLELYEQQFKNIEMDQLLKESQLLSLQSQMNPHFLFNTMNLISRTAMFEGNDTIVKLMGSMSKILRYNLDNIRKNVTLKEEIDIVEAYLYIQSTRFQDSMSFEIDIDDINIEDIYIPPMIIQPIVENSIKHGFKNKEEGRKITIRITQSEQDVLILVEDNGEGISQGYLKEIFDEKGEDNYKGLKVGLRNVKKRLELNFGNQDFLKIESIYGHGTTVIIKIPLRGEKYD